MEDLKTGIFLFPVTWKEIRGKLCSRRLIGAPLIYPQALDVSGMPHVAACGLSALPDLPALRTLRMAGDGYLRPIQVVLNSPVPRLPELCSLDFSGADVLPPGSQVG